MNEQLCGINRDEGMDGSAGAERGRWRRRGWGLRLRWTMRPLPAQVFPLEQLSVLLQAMVVFGFVVVVFFFFNRGFLPLAPQFDPNCACRKPGTGMENHS